MEPTIVNVLGPEPAAITPGEKWDPVAGQETEAYLANIRADARDRVRSEARAILARSSDPKGIPDARAGLIVGYVQSGKTTSMAATAAMARDNEFGIVVLIAGTSDILLRQSRKRFVKALGLQDDDAYRRWEHFESPRANTQDPARIAGAIRAWQNPRGYGDQPTVLISVMKQATHLRNLAEVLHEVNRHIDLSNVPSIVFDDEADQASPNLRRNPGEESATYRDLRRIRDELPWHTLLQYTATPQALLLIGIADEISPDFTCVLDPGADYAGGRYFFMDHEPQFVRPIPSEDLQALDPDATQPPDSLLEALAVFLLGAVAARINRTNVPAQRSMLIHPSQATLPHANFARWTRDALDRWDRTLSLADDDPDRRDLADWFEAAYKDLLSTGVELPPLADLLVEVPFYISRVHVEVVNARGANAPVIEWSRAYAWVLIGGTLMDRGFTVEGLTVTYMPRPIGVGNADTLQQRGRFFGYKRSYADYCRAWLDPQVADAFEQYVRHEESIRVQLVDQTKQGKSLREWKRNFLLDRSLKPTRNAVIRLPFDRLSLAGWSIQDHLVAPGTKLNADNRATADRFVNGLVFRPEVGVDSRRTAVQRHLVATIPLAQAHRDLLSQYAFYEGNATEFTALQIVTGGLDDSELASIYLMSGGDPRRRELASGTTKILNLMQGRNPSSNYPGDLQIHSDDHMTIQVHWVDVTSEGAVVEERVPALAVYVPERLAADILVQR